MFRKNPLLILEAMAKACTGKIIFPLLVILFPIPTLAGIGSNLGDYGTQFSPAMLTGKVKDTSGNPLDGATVSTIAGHSTTTDASGAYILYLDAPGIYTIMARSGSLTATRQTEVSLGATTNLDLQLKESPDAGGSGGGGNNSPAAFDLVSPDDEASGLPTTVTFRWEKTTDPDGDTVRYRFCLRAGDAQFDDSIDCEEASQLAEFGGKNLMYAGLGLGGTGFLLGLTGIGAARSRRWRPMMTMIILGVGVLTTSCSGSNGKEGTEPEARSEVSYTKAGLSPNTTYYWKVIAEDSQGGKTESQVRQFTTGQSG